MTGLRGPEAGWACWGGPVGSMVTGNFPVVACSPVESRCVPAEIGIGVGVGIIASVSRCVARLGDRTSEGFISIGCEEWSLSCGGGCIVNRGCSRTPECGPPSSTPCPRNRISATPIEPCHGCHSCRGTGCPPEAKGNLGAAAGRACIGIRSLRGP